MPTALKLNEEFGRSASATTGLRDDRRKFPINLQAVGPVKSRHHESDRKAVLRSGSPFISYATSTSSFTRSSGRSLQNASIRTPLNSPESAPYDHK